MMRKAEQLPLPHGYLIWELAMQPRVFVGHATADSKIAERFSVDLRLRGADVWLDSSHMGSGDFVARINRALERDVLIVMLSPSAIKSPWVQQEVNAAIT